MLMKIDSLLLIVWGNQLIITQILKRLGYMITINNEDNLLHGSVNTNYYKNIPFYQHLDKFLQKLG